jgi:hypothetical protein
VNTLLLSSALPLFIHSADRIPLLSTDLTKCLFAAYPE